jgi:hypothetical protein
LRIDCKATVQIGDVSRGGLTRGDHQACDHDLGLKEKYIPCGIVEEDRGQLHITFGSTYKTSDFIVDALEAWWAALDETEQVQTWPRHTCHQWGLKTAGLARDVDEMFCRSSTSRDGLLP